MIATVVRGTAARFGTALLGIGLFGVALAAPPAFAADPTVLPVPSLTIYPGDTIRDGSIVDRSFSANFVTTGMVADRGVIVGKLARRTLLPGVPIPSNAVMEPRVVSNGAKVRVVLSNGPLTITTYASALQTGGVGDVVSVRNLESGAVISGVVQADGSVRVNGG